MVVGEVEDAADVVLLAPNVFLHLGVHRARVSASRGGGVRHPSHLLEGGVAAEEVGLVALRGVARQRPHHGAIGLEVVADQIPSGFVARASAASAAAPAASAPSASAAVLLIVLLVPTTAAAAPPSAASPAAPASPSSAPIIQGGIRVPPRPPRPPPPLWLLFWYPPPPPRPPPPRPRPRPRPPEPIADAHEGVQMGVAPTSFLENDARADGRMKSIGYRNSSIGSRNSFVPGRRKSRRTGTRVRARGGASQRAICHRKTLKVSYLSGVAPILSRPGG